MIYLGGCHCGAIRFEIEAPLEVEVLDCNCSICQKAGMLHLVRPLSAFRLLSGDEALRTYTFGSGVAQHKFCGVCGVRPFYIPRSNPDGISINSRCLDVQPETITIKPFDGQNWEDHADRLSHLSEEP